MFSSLASLYEALGISSWGYASRWVSRSAGRRRKLFKSLCGHEEHFTFSNNAAYNEDLPKKTQLPEPSKCLPFRGCSTFGAMALLLRWSTMLPQG